MGAFHPFCQSNAIDLRHLDIQECDITGIAFYIFQCFPCNRKGYHLCCRNCFLYRIYELIERPFFISACLITCSAPNWSATARGQSGTFSSRFSMQRACAQANNELTLTAKSYGAAWNGITVQFVAAADPTDPLGLTYDRYAGTMTFTVDPATTTLPCAPVTGST